MWLPIGAGSPSREYIIVLVESHYMFVTLPYRIVTVDLN